MSFVQKFCNDLSQRRGTKWKNEALRYLAAQSLVMMFDVEGGQRASETPRYFPSNVLLWWWFLKVEGRNEEQRAESLTTQSDVMIFEVE
jgi:hypothetical protein